MRNAQKLGQRFPGKRAGVDSKGELGKNIIQRQSGYGTRVRVLCDFEEIGVRQILTPSNDTLPEEIYRSHSNTATLAQGLNAGC
jgi:hypothetical protein